jgi:putative oxidoreductase
MKALKFYQKTAIRLESLKDVPPLLIRLVLAYGFYKPATMKWSDIGSIAGWFESMGIPFPGLSAYLAASTELAAVILLPLGLATRLISIPLMFTMVVAIVSVHLGNGFEAGNNGFEIPLYYFIMLVVLLVSGPGKFSIDNFLFKKNN